MFCFWKNAFVRAAAMLLDILGSREGLEEYSLNWNLGLLSRREKLNPVGPIDPRALPLPSSMVNQ